MRRQHRAAVPTAAGLVAMTVAVAGLATPAALQVPAPPPFTPPGGVVSGVVINDSGAPLAGADVLLSAIERGVDRATRTDDSGRFAIDDVAAGRYRLTARIHGFAPMEYGASRSDRPGLIVVVGAGQQVASLRLVLPRLASISGVVLEPDGTPAHLARVTATKAAPVASGTTTRIWSSTASNARGEYRLPGLPPGAYRIHASVTYQSATEKAPLRDVFYPDAIDRAGATPVEVAPGDERAGIDLTLQRTRLGRISGTVLNLPPDAAPALFLFPDGLGSSVATPDANGRFTFTGVPPGVYTIETGLIDTPPQFFVPDKKTPSAPAAEHVSAKVVTVGQYAPRLVVLAAPAVGSWGRAEVRVDSNDVEGVVIDLRKTVSVRGRVLMDAAASPASPANVVLTLTPPEELEHLQVRLGFAVMMPRRLRAVPDATGTFAFQPVVPSRFRIEVSAKEAGGPEWFLKAATVGGQDVTDVDFEVDPDRPPSDLVVTVTTLTQRLTGTFVDESGQAPAGLNLVAFPTERRFWLPHSRRVRVATRATDGTFEIPDLPAGDYHLAAFAGAEPDEMSDARFLQPLVPAAIRLTLAPGEHKVQHVRTVTRQHQDAPPAGLDGGHPANSVPDATMSAW